MLCYPAVVNLLPLEAGPDCASARESSWTEWRGEAAVGNHLLAKRHRWHKHQQDVRAAAIQELPPPQQTNTQKPEKTQSELMELAHVDLMQKPGDLARRVSCLKS